MKQNRRTFLSTGLKMGLTLPVLGLPWACNRKESASEKETRGKGLNILILGGTSFLGPHQIAYALERGHRITTFTRGRTEPTIYRELFKDVTPLIGDRSSDLSALEKGEWDVVIDNSGHNVEWAKNSAQLLKDRVGLYLFTSSTGVYYPYLEDNIREDAALVLKEPEGIEDEEVKLEYWYGVMKANSEISVREAFGEDRTLAIRPTYMIGPADKSNRFIHWPVRLARGGEIMVPGKESDPVQYIDVRDVAEWMIRLVEQKKSGTYNAVGPGSRQNVYDFVDSASRTYDVESSFVYVNDYEFLKEQGVLNIIPWILPEGNNYGSARINNQKGITEGLTFRDLQTSVKDTYDWWYSGALSDEKRNEYEKDPGTVLARESSILRAWKEYQG